jgi:hypothetical protein
MVVQACILEPLRLQVRLIDAATLALFKSIDRMNIMGLLRQLRSFMFMGNGFVFHEVTAAVWRMMLLSDKGLTGLTPRSKLMRIEGRINDILRHECVKALDAPSRNVSVRFTYNVSHHHDARAADDTSHSAANAAPGRDAVQWDPYAISNYHHDFVPTFPIEFPEDAVVCSWSMKAYVATHQALFLMNIVHQSLRDTWAALKVAIWDDGANTHPANAKGHSLAGPRWLHMLRGDAQFVVRALQEHASNALFEAWAVFEAAAKDVPHVPGLHRAHQAYVARVSRACFALDDDSLSRMQAALQSCLSIARVITNASQTDGARRRTLLERAMEMKPQLVGAVRRLRESLNKGDPLWSTLGCIR